MGIINVTPDSFSDGGKFLKSKDALEQSIELVNQGVDILDIGAQSTRPGATEIGADLEIERLAPALKMIRNNFPNTLISVDTFLSKVAKFALESGANWINDISAGRRDKEMFNVVAEFNCPYVLMHSRGDSCTMDSLAQYNQVTSDVINHLKSRTDEAISCGINTNQIIWDPGIGFAKTTEQNLTLIKDLKIITNNDFPVLVGPSRKRFIGDVLNEQSFEKRIWGTTAIACKCIDSNVSVIRVHDVEPVIKTIAMARRIW